MYAILSIDGGGMRGLIPARILKNLEQKMRKLSGKDDLHLSDVFDFFAGTSTGGIMVCGYLTPDINHRPAYDTATMEALYLQNGGRIFDQTIYQKIVSGWGLTSPKYTPDGIDNCMREYFGDLKFSQLLKPCMITTYDLLSQNPLYITQHKAKQSDEWDFWVHEATRATASAPSYFPAAGLTSISGQHKLCMDGGLFAFSPALSAYAQVRKIRPSARADSMLILSMGTGFVEMSYTYEEIKQWGGFEWAGVVNEISCTSHANNVNYQLKQVFRDSPNHYVRLDPELPIDAPPMDKADENSMLRLLGYTDAYIEEHQHALDALAEKLITKYQQSENDNIMINRLDLKTTKPWLDRYPQHAPSHVNPDEYANLVLMLENAFEHFADRPGFESFGVQLTYLQIKQYSDAVCAWLQHQGYEKGERVAIMMPNCMAYPVIIYGSLKAGLTLVNINPLYTERELQHSLEDSGTRILFVWEGSAHVAEKVKTSKKIQVVMVALGDLLGIKGTVVNLVSHHIKKAIPHHALSSATPFSEVIDSGSKLPCYSRPLKGADIAFFQYTGGTTGVPKAAMLSHRNLVANTLQAYLYINPDFSKAKSPRRIVAPLPMYHIFSLMVHGFLMPHMGACNVLVTNPRDLPAFIKVLAEKPFHALPGVNTLFNALLKHPDFKHVDCSHLQLTLGGGMAVQKETAEQWHAVTGCPLLQAYGLTETSPAAVIMPHDEMQFTGSIGLPIPSTEALIVNEFNQGVACGEEGELCIRGPQVMVGYWNKMSENSVSQNVDGWLRTGDIARMDEQGFIYILDRKKDMILVSGFNVYPNEVEDVLSAHPAVLECACIGAEDSESGQSVQAFVVLRKGFSATQQEIITFCKSQLTGYKVPKNVLFLDELPKTNVGKILRRSIREQYKQA